jgi:hypothetical protein
VPIGIGTAITAGAAVLGAGATIYAGSQASHAQTSAANTAASEQQAVADENNQLARDMYDANASRLDPYSNMGLQAGDEYMGLLLGPNHTAPGGTTTNGYATIPQPQKLGTGSSSSGSGSAPTLSQVYATRTDGIPGDYQGALAAYYAANPPTQAQVDAMRNDGIPHNAAIAQGYVVQPSSSALAPIVQQHADAAIAAGADPAAVAQRAAQYGVML